MSIIQEYIGELEKAELVNRDNNHYTGLVHLDDAIDVLERFEVAQINELDCETLEKLKNGHKKISESKGVTSELH